MMYPGLFILTFSSMFILQMIFMFVIIPYVKSKVKYVGSFAKDTIITICCSSTITVAIVLLTKSIWKGA